MSAKVVDGTSEKSCLASSTSLGISTPTKRSYAGAGRKAKVANQSCLLDGVDGACPKANLGSNPTNEASAGDHILVF